MLPPDRVTLRGDKESMVTQYVNDALDCPLLDTWRMVLPGGLDCKHPAGL